MSTGGATPAVRFMLDEQNGTDETVTTMAVSVVFYDGDGQEVTSNPVVTFWQTVPPGQTVSQVSSSDGGADITSCSVAGWS